MSEIDLLLADLRGDSSMVRLQSARKLGSSAQIENLEDLRAARAAERDSWVRSALDQAIRTVTLDGATESPGQGWISPPADTATEDIQAVALQNAAQVIVHEARQILRTLSAAAERDVEPYANSSTERELKRLDEFLATVERLQQAADSPRFTEFDLRDLILETIKDGRYDDGRAVVSRQEPLTVRGDPALLKIALRNVLSNAVEASEPSGSRVTINFGRNVRETWVVVLDEGPGLPTSVERAWEPGATTKSKRNGHFGWGLPIAQRATHSFRGKIALTPREGGGASAEIRWDIPSVTDADL